MAEFVGNKDFDSLIEFVGNRLDRSGQKFNRSTDRPDPDNYSDDSSTNRSLAWFSYPSRPHKRRDVDPNFASRELVQRNGSLPPRLHAVFGEVIFTCDHAQHPYLLRLPTTLCRLLLSFDAIRHLGGGVLAIY